jgi:hypothetical protein
MTRDEHYRAAQELLHVFGPGDSAYRTDIPNLLRALARAVLAAADLEVELGAHPNSSTTKGKPA